MAIWLPNKACQCSSEKLLQSGIVDYDGQVYCKMCRGYVDQQLVAELDLTPVTIEASEKTSATQVPAPTSPASASVSRPAPTAAGNVLESAQLATMGYLHSIALVVTAGVVTGFFVAAGLLFSLVFDAPGAAVVFFFVGGVVGIAMLISSVSALLRADQDRSRARSNRS